MHDLAVALDPRPAALAELAEALGRAGISIEGGGAWPGGGAMITHFLVSDGMAAAAALKEAGITRVVVREVLVQRLDQERPGQLGLFTRRLADAGVEIEVLYSDHANQLIVVVDDHARGQAVSMAWEAERRVSSG